jgi:osmotically-inducible protein OsmY
MLRRGNDPAAVSPRMGRALDTVRNSAFGTLVARDTSKRPEVRADFLVGPGSSVRLSGFTGLRKIIAVASGRLAQGCPDERRKIDLGQHPIAVRADNQMGYGRRSISSSSERVATDLAWQIDRVEGAGPWCRQGACDQRENEMTKIDDSEIRRQVLAELDWDPSIDASGVGVAVKEGVVTLTGSIGNYWQKKEVERVAKRVTGVKAVAEDLTIKLHGAAARNDADIAQSVLSGLRFNVAVPSHRIQVTVENGWVTLEGEVEWQYQKRAAEKAVKYFMGVKGVTNSISIKPRVSAADVKAKIERAFARRAQFDANQIKVESSDGKVILRGSVHSWDEKEQAEQAAWAAPGVTNVENDVIVNP